MWAIMSAETSVTTLSHKSPKTHQDTIKSARPATALSVAQGSDTSVQAKTFREDVLDLLCSDRLQLRIQCSLRHNDNRLALAYVTMLHEGQCLE